MAKRKRLGPAVLAPNIAELETNSSQRGSALPIARVAGEAAAEAAVRELSDELARARAEGRLVQDIPLTEIDDTHLSRDRLAADPVELDALMASIAARGQQMAIEVVDKGADVQPRYGLISGWRRVTALRRLHHSAPESYQTVRAVLRRPEGAAEAYLAMVEENELRVGLSYYERAQVAAKSTDLGVFETVHTAIQGLFPTASKAKRSKIAAFARIAQALGSALSFPEAIPERLGLRLAKAVDAGQGDDLAARLLAAQVKTPAEELACLEGLLGAKTVSNKAVRVFPGDISLSSGRRALNLSGAGVDDALIRDLTEWLDARQRG